MNDLAQLGLQIITYVNTERVCAKELVMFRGQTCPEHYHPAIEGNPGEEETFRCRWGEVYLCVPGELSALKRATKPRGHEEYFTVSHEICLHLGDQYTISPETPHWFQAGKEGAIVSEFSTRSRDEYDVFTDPRIARKTVVFAQ